MNTTQKTPPREQQRGKTASRTGQTGKTASRRRKTTTAEEPARKTARQAGRTPSSKSGAANTTGRRRTASSGTSGSGRTSQPQQNRAPKAKKPDLVYTPPKIFNRNRFFLRLATTVAVVIALIFGMSIFFKVDKVTVSGNEKYDAWTIRQASGIEDGENLLTLNTARASGKITTSLPYVKSVRIGIKLPDTVNIVIVEENVLYSIRDTSDLWWLITSDGEVVEQTDSATAGEYTKILGIRIYQPEQGRRAVAEETSAGTDGSQSNDATEETIAKPVTTRGSDRLSTALTIVQYLENNGVIGQAVSVDVTNLGNMELWYGQQYQVKLGDTTQLNYKISAMKAAIDQMADYQSGVLDVSFTTWPDQVGYTPFGQ